MHIRLNWVKGLVTALGPDGWRVWLGNGGKWHAGKKGPPCGLDEGIVVPLRTSLGAVRSWRTPTAAIEGVEAIIAHRLAQGTYEGNPAAVAPLALAAVS